MKKKLKKYAAICLVALMVLVNVVTYLPVKASAPEATDVAYLIDFTGTGTDCPFYTLTDALSNSTGKALTISFDYYLVDAADEELQVMNVSGGKYYADNATGSKFLYAGKHTFHHEVTNNQVSQVVPAIQVMSAKASTAKLYIWNVTITRAGESIFKTNAEQYYPGTTKPALTTMTYGDIPFPSTEGPEATDVAYLIDFTGTTAGTGAFYTLTDTLSNSTGKALTISFDYYLVDEADEELQVMNVSGGKYYADNATGSKFLYAGKHTFHHEVTNNQVSQVVPAIQVTSAKASTAKLYIWNVKITLDGENIFNLNATQWYEGDPKPALTTMTYGDIPFPDAVIGDINISGTIDVRDIVRLKKYLFDTTTMVHKASLDVDLNDEVNDADIVALRELLLTGRATHKLVNGGADKEAIGYWRTIINAKDSLNTEEGTIYYISEKDGDDSNPGTSPEQAWRTLAGYDNAKSKLKLGDSVLFARGGIYRGQLNVVSGVQYGAYGTGDKPAIYGSLKNYIGTDAWSPTDTPNVWGCNRSFALNVGNIVFNHGKNVGVKRGALEELQYNFDFYQDTDKLYLYMEKNPGTSFSDIEICEGAHVVLAPEKCTDVTIDNLSIKYGGLHGISFQNRTNNIVITNCEIAWIGGSTGNDEVRYGNGIEFWMQTTDVLVENNWIYEVYDAGITNQGVEYGIGYTQSDITYKNNLIEYCTYGIEFFTGDVARDTWRNILYEGNIIRFSGYGWGSVRPNPQAVSAICGWGHSGVFQVENFVIKNNILDASTWYLIVQYYPGDINIQYTGNTYYQRANKVARWTNDEVLLATDQVTFEQAIARIESDPKKVQFLVYD